MRDDVPRPDRTEKQRTDLRLRRNVRLAGIAGLIIVAALAGFGAWGHAQRRMAALETLKQQENAVPIVRIQRVESNDAPRTLDLPGSTEAFDAATIYARATGYIATRNVDIGSRVKAGDVLAVIAAPDLDQQLIQARAQLTQLEAAVAQADANVKLAQVTNQRTQTLVVQGWQTKQQGDTDRLTYQAQNAALQVAQANLKAGQAQVSRLEELTGFEKVVAPFDGIITARQIDVGSLVTADVSSGTALFSIARSNVLRIQIYVPQDAVFGLKDGDTAEVRVPEMPGRVFHGTVARNANALQAGTRTRLTEVDVENRDGTLFPGLYCTVRLFIKRLQPVITIPSQAVIFNKNGLFAAVYRDGKVDLRHLDVLADNGATLDIRSGLYPGDRVILDPPVNIASGMRVSTAGEEENQSEQSAQK
ncbi:MAG TPA: efflux RND transporter periplasmic adaptor subunit [Methylovirgula sp.]|nr:efflux RND transporter periplasmic adaptor subunit [Methylovirgula sp.]